MPWYKIEFRSGPGHQSKHVEYEFVEHELDETETNELFEQHSWMYNDAVGVVEPIAALPATIREDFIRDYKLELKHASEMLNILWQTPSA